jgi:hypothetical protein
LESELRSRSALVGQARAPGCDGHRRPVLKFLMRFALCAARLLRYCGASRLFELQGAVARDRKFGQ